MTANPLRVDHVLGVDETGGPLEPWLVRGAIDVIEQHLRSRFHVRKIEGPLSTGSHVLEFGSGSGTPWLRQRAFFVYSVEHSLAWADRVRKVCITHGDSGNGTVLVRPLTDRYEKCVIGLPEMDLVIVDGRRRVRCVRESWSMVKLGGMLVLDNSERSYYQPAIDLLDGLGWKRSDFENSLWRTTIWKRT